MDREIRDGTKPDVFCESISSATTSQIAALRPQRQGGACGRTSDHCAAAASLLAFEIAANRDGAMKCTSDVVHFSGVAVL